MSTRALVFGVVVLLLASGPAFAHLDVSSPMERSKNLGNQKIGPCGGDAQNKPTTRNPANVQVFRPGEKITVRIDETVDHEGYYRVSFDDDGQDIFKFPTAPGTAGHVIPAGTAGVLVPEVKDIAGKSAYTIDVTLPNIECANCTLQVVQLMTEKFKNGAPWKETDGNSIYHRCIDVTLSKSAPAPADMAGVGGLSDLAVTPGADMGGSPDGSPASDMTQPGGAMLQRGCSYGGPGASGLWGGLVLIGLAVCLRRRSA